MSSPDRAWDYVVFSWGERLFRPVRRLLAIASSKPRRAPPAVPPKLRELLKDYPEHIERLQEVLNDFAGPRARSQPFDEAIWALQSRLSSFIQEAGEELEAAEATGDAAEIEKANAKIELMLWAHSCNGGMRVSLMDDLWNYLEKSAEGQ